VQPRDVERVAIDPVDPGSEPAGALLRACFADVVGRDQGREATAGELALAMGEDPSDDLVPPFGLLLAARDGVEAQQLYLRSGYEETAAFNDEPYAERWFRKRLVE
jgi:hypothetical protein